MRPTHGIQITTHIGDEILAVVDELAGLRMAVFRDWPYFYDGDRGYERDYLASYAASPRSLCVVARNETGDVVGASTGIPLRDDGETFHQAFIERGIPLDDVFYFGESVLLAPWRGRGVGHAFFDAREAHAHACGGFSVTALCSARRDDRDPRKPVGYRNYDAFWRGRGYRPAEGMACTLSWKKCDGAEASDHVLDFWVRGAVDAGGTA